MKELEIGQFYKYSGTFQVEYFMVVDEDDWRYFIKNYFYKDNRGGINIEIKDSTILKGSGLVNSVRDVDNRMVIQELFS